MFSGSNISGGRNLKISKRRTYQNTSHGKVLCDSPHPNDISQNTPYFDLLSNFNLYFFCSGKTFLMHRPSPERYAFGRCNYLSNRYEKMLKQIIVIVTD